MEEEEEEEDKRGKKTCDFQLSILRIILKSDFFLTFKP